MQSERKSNKEPVATLEGLYNILIVMPFSKTKIVHRWHLKYQVSIAESP